MIHFGADSLNARLVFSDVETKYGSSKVLQDLDESSIVSKSSKFLGSD